MRKIHFDSKPEHMSEEEFKEEIIAGILERLRASDRIERAAEYYYNPMDIDGKCGGDFATEETGSRKLCVFFRICVVYEDEDGSEAAFHEPVYDMILDAIGIPKESRG